MPQDSKISAQKLVLIHNFISLFGNKKINEGIKRFSLWPRRLSKCHTERAETKNWHRYECESHHHQSLGRQSKCAARLVKSTQHFTAFDFTHQFLINNKKL